MIERTSYLPNITFSSGADYDTLFSILNDWVVEVVLHNGEYHQGFVVWDSPRRMHVLLDNGSGSELLALDDETLPTIREVVVL